MDVLLNTEDKKYIIFSVFQGEPNDLINHKIILDYMEDKGIYYKEVDGMYKGMREKAILVHYSYYRTLRTLLKHKFKQESVMILENHKHGLYKASLDMLQNDTIEPQGYLRNVSYKAAIIRESWFYDPSQEKYFITTPDDTTVMQDLIQLKYM